MERLSVETVSFSIGNKILRVLWKISCFILIRPFSLNIFRGWRCFVLRVFGANIGRQSNVRSTVKIWAPWNLRLGSFSSIGPGTEIYNQGVITIGDRSIISQKSYLCASTHDFTLRNFPLEKRPIHIGDQVWIAADAFIGPGVVVGEGAVVGARSAVFKNVEPWTVVGGNPANFLKDRKLRVNGSVKPGMIIKKSTPTKPV
ncbi:putative colanic acid biosynthesis acetyltransferase [Gramella sp. GC03-9]|uniref:Colanic acid biosynthesis acetyltransferase n=1 Tax=Christiangramia oceanisediminis TaxID=2920386 RepID=A0A9X2I2P6_9FLAO|nr:putative colanic acid biosynthesis acetyltransferase [Gramella oceanisediminis]MCP9199580.1 putative colanic acid biosynthesis acetyltransferase [Gramella oceanisediminis]